MLSTAVSDLDSILAWQIAIAWAGERGEPSRLGWWNTDLVDTNSAGDLFNRLLPRTGPWAALASVREVARRVEADRRASLGDPDALTTLFALGFELSERLDDRLLDLKRQGASVTSLPFPISLDHFSRADACAAFRQTIPPEFTVVAGGRQIKQPLPSSHFLAVQQLAAVLFATDPLPDKYPLAFFRSRA